MDDEITIGSGFNVILYSTLSLSGSLTIDSGSKLIIEQTTLTNLGAIHNSGELKLDHHERQALNNQGTIVNDGLISGMAGFINYGRIQINAGGTYMIDGGDSLSNYGTIINEGTVINQGGIENPGTITNKCPAVFINPTYVDGGPVVFECSPSLCDSPTIIGTEDDETIYGTTGDDVIAGLGGNDVIYGLGGDDIICGGAGNDAIYGGGGHDIIFGQAGDDTNYAGRGNDWSFGGRGNDYLNGGAGNDYLSGGTGNDKLFGSSEDDTECRR